MRKKDDTDSMKESMRQRNVSNVPFGGHMLSSLKSRGNHTNHRNSSKKSMLLKISCLVSILLLVLLSWCSCQYYSGSEFVAHFAPSSFQETASEPFQRGCLNTLDWNPRSTVSVWTMITDGPAYVTSALKLGVSIQTHTTQQVDLVVMELSTKPLSEDTWQRLKSVGWQKCTVDRIPPPATLPGRTKFRFRDQFTKLHLWNMVEYQTIVYLDADTLVVGNLQELLSTRLAPDKKIGAVLDFSNTALVWTDSFNMGVFLLHPEKDEFERLLQLHATNTIATNLYLAEQAWLNQVYQNAWQDIYFVHNAQDAIYKGNRTLWDANSIRVIHYNSYKPWDSWPYNCGRAYQPLCDLWRSAPMAIGT